MEKLKVLYAEDDPLTVMEVAEQLEERGFEVIVATNGTEALKLFRERQPNVVLLDVDMPGHNGFEVLQIIRLTDHYTPIVIYSSLGDEANQMRGLESGAYTYLVKNCAPAVVAAQVYNCLSKNGSDKICLGEKSFFDLLSGELWIGEQECKIAKDFNRVQIRYISEYQDIDIIDYINGNICIGDETNRFRSQEIKLNRIDGNTKIFVSLVNKTKRRTPKGEEYSASLFDVNIYESFESSDSIEMVISLLDKIHMVEKETFFGLLKKDFIQSLNPEY